MTTPGGSNVGTAFGKVRIEYESSGAARAVKTVESLESSLVHAGSAATSSAKQVSKAQSQIVASTQAALRTLEKGVHVKAPINISPSKVELDSGAITKAIDAFKHNKKQTIKVNAPVNVTASKVDIDKGSITRAIDTFSRTQSQHKIKMRSQIAVEATDVSVDIGAIENAIRATQIRQVTVRAPIRVEPSNVDTGQIQQATQTGSRGSGAGGLAAAGGGLAMLGRAGPVGAIAAGALIPVTALSVVLTKGFSRLQGLDQAAVKLSALGKSSEEIAAISQSALKSVEGTAFGLDAAFNTAANAISSGVKPGQELDKYLAAVSNTAALAGVSMEDLGYQFSEAKVQGKLTGDILQSLYARNVPVLQLLADEYGVTQQKAQEMVSNSEVSFDRFVNAMSKNGEAARIMGNTVGGSFSNLMASVSRIGAMLLAPLFGQASGEASTMAQIIQGLTNKLKEFEGWLADNRDGIVDFWVFIGKATLTYGQIVSDVLGGVLKAAGTIASVLNFSDQAKSLNQASESVYGFEQTLDKGWQKLEELAEKARTANTSLDNLGSGAENASPPMQTLSEALEVLGIKADSVSKSITGTVQEFQDLIEQLENKNAPRELIDTLEQLRAEYDNGGRAAESYEEALENMSDQTIDASTKANALITSLQKLGLLPGGNALAEYNKQFDEMTSYARDLPDPLGNVGKSLLNLDGSINTSAGTNATDLFEKIQQIQESMFTLAASGEVPAGEVFGRSAEQLRFILQDYQILGKEADDVINKYLSPGGTGQAGFEAQFSGADPKTIIEQTFADDPAKLNSVLDLMTTKEDIINEITGGPGSTLKIPTTLDVSGLPGASAGSSITSQGSFFNQPGAPKPILGLPPVSGTSTAPNSTVPWYRDFNPTRDLGLPSPGSGSSSTQFTLPDSLKNATDQQIKDFIAKDASSLDPQVQSLLQTYISNAEASGKSLSEAFAEGINSSSEEVRNAILRLAEIAAGGMPGSPAKYGPLSGKGWTLYRGKAFTKAFAEGIASETGTAKGAVSAMAGGASTPLFDQVETMVKDLQELSDFGKSIFDFGKQLFDIGISVATLANDFSGGRLFPKSYEQDPNFKPGGSALGSWNPTLLQNTTFGSPTGRGAAPSALDANPGKQQTANYIIQKAMSLGYTREQANQFVIQAVGESGLNPLANGGNQDGSGDVRGVFQFTPGTWGNRPGSITNAQDNIDAYFDLARERGLTPESFTDPTQLGTQVSIGGPLHPSNVGHRQRAEEAAQQYLNSFSAQFTSAISNAVSSPSILKDTGSIPSGALSRQAATFVQQIWGEQIRGTIGGSRDTGTAPNTHDAGLSIDIPISPDQMGLGDEINSFFQQFGPQLGVKYSIWRNQGRYPGQEGVGFEAGGHFNHVDVHFDKGAQANFSGPGGSVASILGNLPATPQPGGLTGDVWQQWGQANQHGNRAGQPPGTVPVSLPNSQIQQINPWGQNGLPGLPPGLENQRDLLGQMPQDQEGAVKWLQDIDSRIIDAEKQGNQPLVDALGQSRSQVMGQFGLKEGPNAIDQATTLANGVSGIASDIFATIDAGIKYIGALKDTTGTLVRGVSNTQDIMNLIDNFQTGLDFFAKAFQAAGGIASFAGQFTGGSDFGATSAAGGMLQLVSQVITAVNTGIDVAQEGYRIATKYLGRFLTSWLGFPGAQDMKFLLDETTGQLQAYTSENPQMKNVFNTLPRALGKDYPDRPAVANSFVIYQGPGQDPRDTMDDAMFTIKSAGLGAFGYAQ
jgi:tape measure domain-containing protein